MATWWPSWVFDQHEFQLGPTIPVKVCSRIVLELQELS